MLRWWKVCALISSLHWGLGNWGLSCLSPLYHSCVTAIKNWEVLLLGWRKTIAWGLLLASWQFVCCLVHTKYFHCAQGFVYSSPWSLRVYWYHNQRVFKNLACWDKRTAWPARCFSLKVLKSCAMEISKEHTHLYGHISWDYGHILWSWGNTAVENLESA